MIKIFCKYSGAYLSATNQFANFSKVNSNNGHNLVASIHPIMHLTGNQLIKLATSKSLSQYSATERHLLFVALAKYTNTIDISFPITDATISPRKCEELLPILLDAVLAIANNQHLWKEAILSLPTTRICEANHKHIDLDTWLNMLIVPAANTLQYSVDGKLASTRGLGIAEKTPSELDLEVALKEDLTNWKESNKRNKYTRDLAAWACNKWQQGSGHVLDSAKRTRIAFLLNAPIDKVKDSRELEQLRVKLVSILPRTNTGTNQDRTNTLLILRHIDSRLEYFESVVAMFGGDMEEVESDLPEDLGVSYTIKKATGTVKKATTFNTATVKRTAKQNDEAARHNPILAKLLAMKGA